MVFSNDDHQGMAASRMSGVRRWPNGVVPYVVDRALPAPERVTEAADHWRQKTGIRFVPRTNEADYVRFINGTGCFSHIGRQGGQQDIVIRWVPGKPGDSCPVSAVIHEMGHAIGLAHEQGRFDRDNYVTIHWENIEEKWHYAFDKTNFQSIGEYDLQSIMHYPGNAFSKNGKPTITAKNGAELKYPSWLTEKDAAGTRSYYERELKGDNSDLGGGVSLTWSRKSNTATYSLDVQDRNDSWLAPCLGSATLQRELATMFGGSCPDASGRSVGMQHVKAFRLCWAENEDWAHASCKDTPYKGETSLVIGQ
ncbi:MAG TPA: M12 family metallopeptidase [Labilithrix sp.]|nr:M12 family metallopeptidase [Labilithrix sp.]